MGCVQSQESSGSSSPSGTPKSGNTVFNSVDDIPGVPKRVFVEWEVERRGGGWDKLGRMEITLFSNTPKTSTNFGAICNGIAAPKGLTNSKGDAINVLKYEGHESHRIIPGFMCQFGDITEWNTNRPGTGGACAFGQKRFDDENFVNTFPQNRVGTLAMANAGPNTNGSQVFLCTSPCQHLYKKHVVFGQVDEQYIDIVKKMESYGTSSGAPKYRVRCSASGILEYYTKEELAAVDPRKDQTRE